jgi:hypothetical protein
MLRELASGYWSHKPCQGIQDREVACCCWVVYIGIGPRIGAKGGVNGGPTMVGPDAMTRACYYRRRCCHCLPPPPPPPRSWTRVHVDGPGPRVVEGGPRWWGRAGLTALALVALTESVAIIITTAAYIILAIATMVTTLSLTLATIPRGTRWSRGRQVRGVVGVKCLRGRHGHVDAECEFLQD